VRARVGGVVALALEARITVLLAVQAVLEGALTHAKPTLDQKPGKCCGSNLKRFKMFHLPNG